MRYVYSLITLAMWILGIVAAKGFWSTFFAVLIAPYSWYLAVVFLLQYFGILAGA